MSASLSMGSSVSSRLSMSSLLSAHADSREGSGGSVAGRRRRLRARPGVALAVAVALWSAPCASGYPASPFSVWDRMAVSTQPSSGTGGTPLSVQPCVALLDQQNRLVNTDNNSYYVGKRISARFVSSKLPVGAPWAVLQQEGVDTTLVYPSAPISGGYACFSGLKVSDLARGYVINFYSVDDARQVDSAPFNILLGPPDALVVMQQPGSAFGGEPFLPQPRVGVVDRGLNPVSTLPAGFSVTISLCDASDGLGCAARPDGRLLLTDASSALSVPLVQGVATFVGLAIDVAGTPYQLLFTCSYTGVNQRVLSDQLFVGVGRAVEVRMERPVLGARGGMAFAQQPRISLRDRGGNVVTEDALHPPKSSVLLTLSNNPTNAILSSAAEPGLAFGLSAGLLEPADLVVDKLGQGYQLRFAATMRTPSNQVYQLHADSAPFDVTLGEPAALVVQTPVGGAYAGGLPFYQQPVITLEDAGGNVFHEQSSVLVSAALVVSPTGFPLAGATQAAFFRGTARFRSLSLLQVGQGYRLRFSATVDGHALSVEHSFEVLPSTEYEVMADDAERGDRLGAAVSMFDETVLAGAPYEDTTVFEVQRLTTESLGAPLVREVQRLTTRASTSIEVQTVSCCGAGGTLAGYFTLSWRGVASRPLKMGLNEELMAAYLEADVPALGDLTVEKVPNPDPACTAANAWLYTIYFDTLVGEVPELVANDRGVSIPLSPDPDTFYYSATEFRGMQSASAQLGAAGAAVAVRTVADSPVLGGTFRLRVGGDGTALGAALPGAWTAALPFDASGLQVKVAVEAAVRSLAAAAPPNAADYAGFLLIGVSRAGPDVLGGFAWEVTFPARAAGVYDWRQLEPDGAALTGRDPVIAVTTVQSGTAPLGGSWALWHKGAGPSRALDFQASAADVEAALEALDSVDDVAVARSLAPSAAGGYVWTVTFLATRALTEYGWVPERAGTRQPPLQPDTFLLGGTGAELRVEYIVNSLDTLICSRDTLPAGGAGYDAGVAPGAAQCVLRDINAFLLPQDMPQMGKPGDETGAAYVLYRDHAAQRWRQAAKLLGSDSKSYDRFGWAVAYDNSTSAMNTQAGVAVVGAPNAAYIGDNEQQLLRCFADAGAFLLLFRTVATPRIPFDVTAPQLKAALQQASSITEVQVVYYLGSYAEANALPDGSGHGLCQPRAGGGGGGGGAPVLAKVTFVYPADGDMPMIETRVMDTEVEVRAILTDSTAAPGLNGQRIGEVLVSELTRGTVRGKTTGEDGYTVGAAYVFLPAPAPGLPEAPTRGWLQDAKLLASDGRAGDEFGLSVSVHLDTIAVGAPYHMRDAAGRDPIDAGGAVYVFTRDGLHGGDVGVWTQSQKLTAPDRQAADLFGSTVLVKENTLVVSAPGRNGGRGRVYVFTRVAISLEFTLNQVLNAPDGAPGDRFGSALAVDVNTLLVGAENRDGPVPAPAPAPAPGGSTSTPRPSTVFMAGAEQPLGAASVASDGAGLKRCGAVYSFTRATFADAFYWAQTLTARTPRHAGRFGHAVALERDLAVVTEQEEYGGPQGSRRYIFKVTTAAGEAALAANPGAHIGNLFQLTWQASPVDPRNGPVLDVGFVRRARQSADAISEGQFRALGDGAAQRTTTRNLAPVTTEPLAADVSALEMQRVVSLQLGAGDVLVTRTSADAHNGYTWMVTFANLETTGGKSVPWLGAVNMLSGGGEVSVTAVQEPNPFVHGLAHVFKRSPATSGAFREHALLRPEVPQDGDLFGSQVSMHGRFAAIGAPNRDKFDTSGVNPGAVYVFDMSFVNVVFEQATYTVGEGDGSKSVGVQRCGAGAQPCLVGSAPTPGPRQVGFGMNEPNHVQFKLVDGTARSRGDCKLDSRATGECLWLDADSHGWDAAAAVPEALVDVPRVVPDFRAPAEQAPYWSTDKSRTYSAAYTAASLYHKYDFRAVSDYAPAGGQLGFGPGVATRSFDVVVTNDDVHEAPDETVNLLLFSAGMRPVPGGDYWAVLTIEDDGDGGVGLHTSFEQMYATQPADFAHVGSATSIAGDVTAMAAPDESAGAVYLYRRTAAGVWELEQRLISPNAAVPANGRGRFGASVQLSDMNPHRVIVGAPSERPPSAYVFMRVAADANNPAPRAGPGAWQLEATFALDPAVVFDSRCDPARSGFLRRCKNDHNPINADAFFAAENAVAIHGVHAIVGAKGLEAAFVYRMHGPFHWYLVQMLKPSTYQDAVFPLAGEHSKVYVTREHFGGAVAIFDDTVVVGATLAENERYRDAHSKTDQDVGLLCAQLGFRVGAPSSPALYRGHINQWRNAYHWAPASAAERQAVFNAANRGSPFVSDVTCEELDAFTIVVRSTGLPDHPMGAFPLPDDSLFAGAPDNPNAVRGQSWELRMPRFPNITQVNPRSVLQDRSALPSVFAFALNGVPFISPLTAEGDDSTKAGLGYSGNVQDLCNGVAAPGAFYAYRGNPVCLYPQPPQVTAPQLDTGKLFPFAWDPLVVSNPSPGQRSPKIGYALDGFPIFGPFDESGALPADLDVCNGRFDSQLGSYVYHVTPWRAPYIIGCLRGSPATSVPPRSNPFPEPMDNSKDPRDLGWYAKGAVYLFMLKPLRGRPYASVAPATVGGQDLTPKPDPFLVSAPQTTAWLEHRRIVAADGEYGDRYGHAIAIDGDQMLVASPMDTAKPRTTWDFESGDLRGWAKTGTAFDLQPTFGDNPAFRNVYGDKVMTGFADYAGATYEGSSSRQGVQQDILENPEGKKTLVPLSVYTTDVNYPSPVIYDPDNLHSPLFAFRPGAVRRSGAKGQFWVGTYESRPGRWDAASGRFVQHSSIYRAGKFQGDEPQGTLTSDTFPIYGTKMQFLIGGGCDVNSVYVELLVDGVAVRRATGLCDEQMREVTWNLTAYRWQAGVVRIVDASSRSPWGHINVDDFRFNWDQSYMFRSSTPGSTGSDARPRRSGSMAYTGEPAAGAVYVYRRESGSLPGSPCELACNVTGCYRLSDPIDRTSCAWVEAQKLQPTDRRAYERFGWSVAVDDALGVAVVGAPGARVVDQDNNDDEGGDSRTGAVYMFQRVPEVRTVFGTLLFPPYWPPNEVVKFQHPSKGETGPDHFGHAVGLSAGTVVVGAPYKAAMAPVGANSAAFNAASLRLLSEGGAAFVYDGSIVNVRFKQAVYVVNENHPTVLSYPNSVRIQVQRRGDLSQALSVGYSTSDLTANGISEAMLAYCTSVFYKDRGRHFCGDYVQQSGIVTFFPHDNEVEFTLRTVNDNCNEHRPEFVRLQLSLPGGPPLLGAPYVALLRIDDDDGAVPYNRLFCPQLSAPVSPDHPLYSLADDRSTQGTPARAEHVPRTELMDWILQQE